MRIRAMLSVYQEGIKTIARFEFFDGPARVYEPTPSSVHRLAYVVHRFAMRRRCHLRPFMAPTVGYVLEFSGYREDE